MTISSSIRSRFRSGLESNQIDDDYLTPSTPSQTNLRERRNHSAQQYLNQNDNSNQSLPALNHQISQTNLRSSLSQNSRSVSFPTIHSSNLYHHQQSLQNLHGIDPLNDPVEYDPNLVDSSILHDQQFDPDEAVPTYETSQMLHQNSSNNLHHINYESSYPTQSQPLLHNRQDSSNDIASTLLSHLYTPIPSLPIPRNNSTSMLHSESSESSLSNNTISYNPDHSSQIHQSTSSITLHNHQQQNKQQNKNKFKQTSIKKLGLKFLNARQHFLLASCRDVSLLPPLFGLFQSWKRIYIEEERIIDLPINRKLTTARGLEHFLTGLWCIVATYLSYSILDSLLVRWIITYSTSAAIVRVLSMSTIMITIELYLVSTFSATGYQYGLHIWILISCLLTLTFIVQNFVTSNLQLEINQTELQQKRNSNHIINDEEEQGIELVAGPQQSQSQSSQSSQSQSQRKLNNMKRQRSKPRRFFDFYNIVVFAVVPVGLASFVTMIGLLRSLLILRIDVDQAFQQVR
ncbi:uncharacterized protein KGF55_003733 [Candida pseudojiufengensis]|uniref:uncharacterized protein n=1 Tax=Candida pseudojiufengensis TaxID=497109 RepID=UPI002224854C|nr:uncharacterized protein KGF55_003733 [Candida pseudojiufengensis]KAI5962657.1 hypothetical protein KGF55_003733 [Candida pseudojiufengensis]